MPICQAENAHSPDESAIFLSFPHFTAEFFLFSNTGFLFRFLQTEDNALFIYMVCLVKIAFVCYITVSECRDIVF